VCIYPTRIEMTSSDIYMKGANKILQVTSNGVNTSVIQISPSEGIWIGSNAGIRLYSGTSSWTYNDIAKKIYTTNSNDVIPAGASVELTPSHILFGASASNATAALEITQDSIILGLGDVYDNYNAARTIT